MTLPFNVLHLCLDSLIPHQSKEQHSSRTFTPINTKQNPHIFRSKFISSTAAFWRKLYLVLIQDFAVLQASLAEGGHIRSFSPQLGPLPPMRAFAQWVVARNYRQWTSPHLIWNIQDNLLKSISSKICNQWNVIKNLSKLILTEAKNTFESKVFVK